MRGHEWDGVYSDYSDVVGESNFGVIRCPKSRFVLILQGFSMGLNAGLNVFIESRHDFMAARYLAVYREFQQLLYMTQNPSIQSCGVYI